MTKMFAGVVLMVVTGLTTSTATGYAQDVSSLDSRWVPWLGCWQLSEEQFETGAPALDEDTSALVERTYVCVTPTADSPEINLTAVAGSDVLVERTLIADGMRREVREPGCVGWEESEWASDGHRLFTRAELRCDGHPDRTVDGVSLMTSASTWVDIQVVETGTRQLIEVRRYTPVPVSERDALLGAKYTLPVPAAEVRQARRESAAAVTLDDVMEANVKTRPRVVETWLVEIEPRLALDSEALISLDDAGINEGVIDLLVALSYPDRFVVERRNRGGSWSSGGFGGFGGHYDPAWYGALYPYYVTPLGYRGWGGGYDPYLIGGLASPFVVVGGAEIDDRTGKAVRDRGYTRVRSRDVTGAQRRARPREGFGGGASSSGSTADSGSSGSSSGSGSGGAAASPGGYSRGGSSSGRQAVPRK